MAISLVQLIINSIFNGTCILVPILFFIQLFKINIPIIGKSTLICAVNCTLLSGSLLFLVYFPIEIVSSYYSGGEYEQFTLSTRISGSFWTDFLILVIFPNALLPQLLWFKKIRQTIISSFTIVSIWFLLYLLTNLFEPHQPKHIQIGLTWFFYLKFPFIYILIVGLMYYFAEKKFR